MLFNGLSGPAQGTLIAFFFWAFEGFSWGKAKLTIYIDRFRSVYNNDLNIYKNIESLLYRSSRHVPDSVAYILDEVSRLIILFGTGLLLRSTSKVQINTVSAMLSSGHLKQ